MFEDNFSTERPALFALQRILSFLYIVVLFFGVIAALLPSFMYEFLFECLEHTLCKRPPLRGLRGLINDDNKMVTCSSARTLAFGTKTRQRL